MMIFEFYPSFEVLRIFTAPPDKVKSLKFGLEFLLTFIKEIINSI